MADVFSEKQRSAVMSRIRSRGNMTTELAFVSLLRSQGIKGWRRHQNLAGGNPDFVFRDHKVCVFVDGCFWHGCPRCFRAPASNSAYWGPKIARNRQRDRRIERALNRAGFRVFRLWECQLRQPSYTASFIAQVKAALRGKSLIKWRKELTRALPLKM